MNTCRAQYDNHMHLAGFAFSGSINWLQSLPLVALPRERIVAFASATQAGHGWTRLDQAGPVALGHGHVEKQGIYGSYQAT